MQRKDSTPGTPATFNRNNTDRSFDHKSEYTNDMNKMTVIRQHFENDKYNSGDNYSLGAKRLTSGNRTDAKINERVKQTEAEYGSTKRKSAKLDPIESGVNFDKTRSDTLTKFASCKSISRRQVIGSIELFQ